MKIDPPNESVYFQIKENDLFKAAETGDSSIFKSLSEEHLTKSLNLWNESGRSLLHVAVSSAHPEVVKVLSATADESVVNGTDEEGWAPIHSAASIGANVNVKNGGGCTALLYAASKGWLKIAELLISHGAKINPKDKVGCTPLHRAASTGNSALCELLIEEGVEVDATDRAGQIPLMNAVICYNEVAFLLIRHGADVDIEEKEGYTVLGQASNDFRPILINAAKAMPEG